MEPFNTLMDKEIFNLKFEQRMLELDYKLQLDNIKNAQMQSQGFHDTSMYKVNSYNRYTSDFRILKNRYDKVVSEVEKLKKELNEAKNSKIIDYKFKKGDTIIHTISDKAYRFKVIVADYSNNVIIVEDFITKNLFSYEMEMFNNNSYLLEPSEVQVVYKEKEVIKEVVKIKEVKVEVPVTKTVEKIKIVEKEPRMVQYTDRVVLSPPDSETFIDQFYNWYWSKYKGREKVVKTIEELKSEKLD